MEGKLPDFPLETQWSREVLELILSSCYYGGEDTSVLQFDQREAFFFHRCDRLDPGICEYCFQLLEAHFSLPDSTYPMVRSTLVVYHSYA